MRGTLWASTVVLFFAPLTAFGAQQQSDKTPPPSNPPATMPAVAKPAPQQSLAEAARKAREKKAAEAKTKVWDNDNIPGAGSVTTATAAGGSAAPLLTIPLLPLATRKSGANVSRRPAASSSGIRIAWRCSRKILDV
jgi:hypothetical protein